MKNRRMKMKNQRMKMKKPKEEGEWRDMSGKGRTFKI